MCPSPPRSRRLHQSIPMLPSDCVLERRVRSDGDQDLAPSTLPLYILQCKYKKVHGYVAKTLKIYNERLQRLKIGVRLAGAPPAVSHLVILGVEVFGQIVAVDKTVIVITLGFFGVGGQLPYLIYDAVALSLRLIAPPEDPSWRYTLSSNVSIARPCQGDVYALVHTGVLAGVDKVPALYLWRPSSSLPPWSEKKKSSFPDLIDWSLNTTDMEFSFNGHAYWVDLLGGVSYCRCDALFDDKTSVANFGGFIPLPEKGGHHHRSSGRVSQPDAYRNMGVVRDSFIRFVSIDGFQNHVKLKHRTVTVWKLLSHDQPWVEEHKFSLKTLWGFEGFGKVPKDLTLMYPHLSTNDADLVYLVLGEYRENQYKGKFIATYPRYLLAVDMKKKTVTSVPLDERFPDRLFSCGFSQSLCQALVGPCNDKGNPKKEEHRMKKKRRYY